MTAPLRDALSLTGARWSLRQVEGARVAQLAASTGLSEPASRCLALRYDGLGLPDPADWLHPRREHLHDPLAMRNMEAALDRLRHAVARRQRVRIITDYDVDGTTSSLILQAALRLVDPRIDISYHIPSRFDEGYGFSVQAARKAADDGVDLVITADIGVRDHAAVAAAREAGLDVLVCDHHLPAGASVPEGATVLCPPQEGCAYPNRSLAACGVSLKLAQGLLGTDPRWDRILASLLKLAAVGTVADLVPLTTLENRAIVALGLQELNRGRHHPGLASLLKVSNLQAGGIRASDLGFRIGPRINAAGRLAEANLVVELLNSRDPGQAQELAGRLDALNRERRDIQERLVREALERLEGNTDPFVVLAGREDEGWHRGVVGIVASRIKDEVHRPTAIVSIQGELAVGSLRSIHGVHAVEALDAVSDLLVKYGGHPAAAGFTLRADDLDTFRQRLCAHVDAMLTADDMVRVRSVDAAVAPDQLTDALHDELRRLGPFGMGNARPSLLLEGIRAATVDVRAKGRLLAFRVPAGRAGVVEAVWWNQARHADVLREQRVDLVATLGENTWRGVRRLQLDVKDARPSHEG